MRPSFARAIATLGIGWSIAFVALGLACELQTYGDGAIFSYAAALGRSWEYHWHNIPGRILGQVVTLLPAETLGALTGSARVAIFVYGALHFSAPLLSLLLTRACDATPTRAFFHGAALSTAVLCPLVFGFPTEMWMTHALFWPALARMHTAGPGIGGTLATFALVQAFVLTHEGAVALLAAMLATLLAHRDRGRIGRALALAALALAVWFVVKRRFPPDAYIAEVLGAAAWKFIDPANLAAALPLLLAATLLGQAFVAWTTRRLGWRRPHATAVAAVTAVLVAYWLAVDDALHADARYAVRTVLLVALPAFALATASLALDAAAIRSPLRPLAELVRAVAGADAVRRFLLGALTLISLVHGVETAKFAARWLEYRSALRGLATGDSADPALGDPRFVSARRIDERLDRLSWNSTTPYLSVLLAPEMRPRRLVVDPRAAYFWLSCDVARRSAIGDAPIPRDSRELIAVLACLHR